ncbi:DASH complex subunit dad4 [Halteromyces radiatus]|uniref:DASH complex subunit dad4 n=1 Tax=Halteromyces radiatus TaxID=101107 RepID=UPI00221E7FCD|nr:DASH complex subunit dad4 [Halteromyces radiatus]KAI8099354.1 DASH complex subunit dad4 [Halteromyces radiatus]
MENPYEQRQNALLNRIVTNVSKLNTSITELNERLEKLNKDNNDVAVIAQMWCSYDNSVQIHLESTKTFSAPL